MILKQSKTDRRRREKMKIRRSVGYAILLAILSHIVGQCLPRRWFHPERFPYEAWAWEQGGNIYKRIHVQQWKDLVPDMSKILPDMLPKRVNLGATAEDVTLLIQETCVAEAIHWGLIFLSPGIYFLCPNGWGVAMMLFDIILLNLPYIVIQRYNRPKLLRLAEKLRRKEET